jgi:hypothetical protein
MQIDIRAFNAFRKLGKLEARLEAHRAVKGAVHNSKWKEIEADLLRQIEEAEREALHWVDGRQLRAEKIVEANT